MSAPPVVEIEKEATAAYVRFSPGKVAKTQPFWSRESMVMVDRRPWPGSQNRNCRHPGVQHRQTPQKRARAAVKIDDEPYALRHGKSCAHTKF